ncbi:MAG TPA: DUF2268 domain-containing putative Zn-dependent protease [Ignavibacteria bacterium]|nr:DUF2268 domain-containing putative Zn-dependent protease [Ignavibacteria bacterium]
MTITDLTDNYVSSIIIGKNVEEYYNSCPFLFEHYFEFWGDKNYKPEITDSGILLRNRDLILKSLEKISVILQRNNADTENINVIIFAGQSGANGHAFIYDNKSYAWIAAECYTSELYCDVMCSHEIGHALHYSTVPELSFRNMYEKELVKRQLITEGLASYFTKQIFGTNDITALWADHCDKTAAEKWMNNFETKSSEIIKFVKENFYRSDSSGKLFSMIEDINISNSDPFMSRGGYLLGLKLTEYIADEYNENLFSLLKMPAKEIEGKFYEALKNFN